MPEVNAAQVVIMGLVTVFIALICLIIIIVLLGKIMVAVTGNKASQPTPAPAPAPAPAAPAAPRPRLRSLATSSWWPPSRQPLLRTWARMWTTSRSCPSAGCNTHQPPMGNPHYV